MKLEAMKECSVLPQVVRFLPLVFKAVRRIRCKVKLYRGPFSKRLFTRPTRPLHYFKVGVYKGVEKSATCSMLHMHMHMHMHTLLFPRMFRRAAAEILGDGRVDRRSLVSECRVRAHCEHSHAGHTATFL